jgi:hypothetical protein
MPGIGAPEAMRAARAEKETGYGGVLGSAAWLRLEGAGAGAGASAGTGASVVGAAVCLYHNARD